MISDSYLNLLLKMYVGSKLELKKDQQSSKLEVELRCLLTLSVQYFDIYWDNSSSTEMVSFVCLNSYFENSLYKGKDSFLEKSDIEIPESLSNCLHKIVEMALSYFLYFSSLCREVDSLCGRHGETFWLSWPLFCFNGLDMHPRIKFLLQQVITKICLKKQADIDSVF